MNLFVSRVGGGFGFVLLSSKNLINLPINVIWVGKWDTFHKPYLISHLLFLFFFIQTDSILFEQIWEFFPS